MKGRAWLSSPEGLADWHYEFDRIKRIKAIEAHRNALALKGPYYDHATRTRLPGPDLQTEASASATTDLIDGEPLTNEGARS